MVKIEKRNYQAYSGWYNCIRHYTEYSVVINGTKSYFGRLDNDCKRPYEIGSRHQMAVRLDYFRKTGYRYVDCQIPSAWHPGFSIQERLDFIRKNGYTPTEFAELYRDDELNAWVFCGNLLQYSYSWFFIIYDKKVVDDIIRQLKEMPEVWHGIVRC